MYIKFGDRRINMAQIKEYRPDEKSLFGKKKYSVILLYGKADGEELSFFDDDEARNKFIEELDKRLL